MIPDYLDLRHCDNMELMAQYPDKHFDLAIVDPPYGIGMGASLNVNSKTNFIDKAWDKEIPKDKYFQQLFRVSKNQIVWGGNYFPYLWQKGCKDFVCWNKLNHHENRADIELAWTSFNGLSKYYEYMWDGNRYGVKGNIQGVGLPSLRIHPTQKPVQLYKWLLKNYAKEGDKILDTHLGSMSIAIAVHEMNKQGMNLTLTGCELDEDYYNQAMKRVENACLQMSLI